MTTALAGTITTLPKSPAISRDVKVGDVETVNCHATDSPERDTHRELVLDSMNGSEDRRVRKSLRTHGPSLNSAVKDWSTPALGDQFHGRWVRVRGWLLFDTEHLAQSLNTPRSSPRLARYLLGKFTL